MNEDCIPWTDLPHLSTQINSPAVRMVKTSGIAIPQTPSPTSLDIACDESETDRGPHVLLSRLDELSENLQQ